jgi:hypothetical protein
MAENRLAAVSGMQREEKGKAKENEKKQHIRKMKGVYA